MMSKAVLYISYDGMTDPLGQSQVLPYLRQLSQRGYSFTLLSFEKEKRFAAYENVVRDFIKDFDICWHPLPYTKTPPVLSTLKDLLRGWKEIKKIYANQQQDIVHCRSYIASLLGLKCKKKFGSKFIFDMRGWWADEKLESGNWSSFIYKLVYRYFKRKEKEFFSASDHCISLTHSGKKYIINHRLKNEKDVTVIPTCVDHDIFKAFDESTRKKIRTELGIAQDTCVLIYSGSMGGNYRNDLVFSVFKTCLKTDPSSILLLLTTTEPALVSNEILKFNIPSRSVIVKNCNFSEMGTYLMAGDAGLIFYDNQFSAIGRSPTKLGEYWASGLPFISGSGIGDLEMLNDKFKGGAYLLKDCNETEYKKALAAILPASAEMRKKLRSFTLSYFDLHKGAQQYETAFTKCSGNPGV